MFLFKLSNFIFHLGLSSDIGPFDSPRAKMLAVALALLYVVMYHFHEVVSKVFEFEVEQSFELGVKLCELSFQNSEVRLQSL